MEGENVTFGVVTVVQIVIFASSLVGVWYKLAGKIKVMDLELSNARKEVQDECSRAEKSESRIEKLIEENKVLSNKRIDRVNNRVENVHKDLSVKFDELQKEVHIININTEKNKNEILQAIRDSKK